MGCLPVPLRLLAYVDCNVMGLGIVRLVFPSPTSSALPCVLLLRWPYYETATVLSAINYFLKTLKMWKLCITIFNYLFIISYFFLLCVLHIQMHFSSSSDFLESYFLYFMCKTFRRLFVIKLREFKYFVILTHFYESNEIETNFLILALGRNHNMYLLY